MSGDPCGNIAGVPTLARKVAEPGGGAPRLVSHEAAAPTTMRQGAWGRDNRARGVAERRRESPAAAPGQQGPRHRRDAPAQFAGTARVLHYHRGGSAVSRRSPGDDGRDLGRRARPDELARSRNFTYVRAGPASAAGQRALGSHPIDARHDGHDPEPGHERCRRTGTGCVRRCGIRPRHPPAIHRHVPAHRGRR